MSAFDGFEHVGESDLPKIIDTLHIADATTDEFTSRFRFRQRYLISARPFRTPAIASTSIR